jgi:hypothetical protein
MHARPTHLTGTPRRSRQGWPPWYITWSVAIVTGLGLALLSPAVVQARTFQCSAGEVACLIASIRQANVQPGQSHEIRLAAGVYTLMAGENETSGNGLPSITSTLTIRGVGAETTVIERGAAAPTFRLMHVAVTGTLTLQDLGLRGGWTGVHGGGLWNDGGRVTIIGSTFADNTAGAFGGGLYNDGGTVSITRATFTRNGAWGAGGGLYNDGGMVSIAHAAFIDNGAANSCGGLADGGTLTLTNSTVAGNSAGQGVGGGICGGNSTYVLNSTIVDNSAVDGFLLHCGGGITGAVLQNTILAHNICQTSGPQPSDCMGGTSLGNNLIGDLTGCSINLLSSDRVDDPDLDDYADDGSPGSGHYPLIQGSPAINAANPTACPKTDQLGEKRVGACDIGAIEFQGTAVSSR